MNLPSRGYLATSGNTFGCHKWQMAYIWWAGAQDAAKHPAVYQTIFQKPRITQP